MSPKQYYKEQFNKVLFEIENNTKKKEYSCMDTL